METVSRLEKQEYISHMFENTSDFVYMEAKFFHTTVHVCYLQTLVDYESTEDMLVAKLSHIHADANPIEQLVASHLSRVDQSLTEIVNSILLGMLIIFPEEGYENIIINPSPISTSRSVTEAQTENPIQTALDAFTEDMNLNLSLIRRKMRTRDLIIQNHTVGTKVPREVAVLYVEGQADPKVVELINDCLIENSMMEVSNIQELLKVLKQPSFSLVPTYLTSELPSTTKHNLMDGRVVIFLDHFPFSLSFPSIVSDFWEVKTDKDQLPLFMYLYRVIRITSLIVAVTMPGLYVVLNSVNPELCVSSWRYRSQTRGRVFLILFSLN
ncbi:spore germination protein [Paenibacillus sp. N3.4]|uniref:spore germination protein n=1 Tax=Paenibacillus sp. N3.4 TaxID=2603222 RepID=UPI0011C9285B|nr:spore germination protein [Paenibacillus sp. N3.4]TXK85679.1 spore germination protein [Paenibacillus sp. N3.4]